MSPSVTFAMENPGNERGARIEAEVSGSVIGSETEVHEVRFNRVDLNFFRHLRGSDPGGPWVRTGRYRRRWRGRGQPAIAQRIFGGSALGRRIRYVERSPGTAAEDMAPGRWYEIVGIVSDFPTGASQGMRDTELKVYHAVAAGQVQPAVIAIRMRDGAPSTFTQRLREIALAVDPYLHLRDVRSLDEALRSEQWISRMTAAAFAAIAGSVLLLSSAGIYALVSFTVSQRRKEIGIRMALGADWKGIVASIFSRALLQLGAGVVLGAALGVAVEKASGGVIMRGNMAVVLPAVALVMMVVGFLAALGPARRSLRIEPTEALREQ